ncbi:MAG: MOSC domain-containing protein, partial [Chloroflexi bacterium]|nr:MOSC domain-containing protein [Chloroflexota bacterium]
MKSPQVYQHRQQEAVETTMSRIYSIVYQPKPSKHQEPFHYTRVPVETATLIADYGIEGDRKAGKNKTRQVNLLGYDWVQEMNAKGYKTEPGELGEQIIVEGLDVFTLNKGDRLQIGEVAIIEITKPRTPCEWFAAIQGKDYDSFDFRVGMLARVIEGGVIRVGDCQCQKKSPQKRRNKNPQMLGLSQASFAPLGMASMASSEKEPDLSLS